MAERIGWMRFQSKDKIMNRRVLLVAVMALLPVQSHAQLEASSLEDCYGKIRADIVRGACKIVGFDKSDVMDSIKNESLQSFYQKLKKETNSNVLYRILHDSRQDLSGTDVADYDSKIKAFRKSVEIKLLEACADEERNLIIQHLGQYIAQIDSLTKECYSFNGSVSDDYASYVAEYQTGRFISLVPEEFRQCVTESPLPDVVNTDDSESSKSNNIDDHNVVKRIILLLCLLIAASAIILRHKKRVRIVKNIECRQSDNQLSLTTIEDEPHAMEPVNESSSEKNNVDLPPETDDLTDIRPHIADCKGFAEDAGEWIIVGASVQGHGHIEMNMPCQDSCGYKYLQDGWGIAVTADGAGSAEKSQVGALIAVQRAVVHFENLVHREHWIEDDILPTEARWMKCSYDCLKLIHDEIESFAKQKEVDFKSLSSTIIVVVHSPIGLLACHVGDGRAGYKAMDGSWHSLITPHKGVEANQTIFITSEFWNIPFYEMSGVTVPEARVITEKAAAFVLMSDGCEHTSWKCNQYNPETNKYYDPNLPHQPFFDSVVNTLQSFREDKIAEEERKNKWVSFIKEGNSSFYKESDDKTMIVGSLYV